MWITKAERIRWNDFPRERLSDKIERRFVSGKQITMAQFFLAKGCLVPRHAHANEQLSYVLEGVLRFRLGAEGEEQLDVRAGEVLLIPPDVPHDAEALEDTFAVDVFSPVREDWYARGDAYLRG